MDNKKMSKAIQILIVCEYIAVIAAILLIMYVTNHTISNCYILCFEGLVESAILTACIACAFFIFPILIPILGLVSKVSKKRKWLYCVVGILPLVGYITYLIIEYVRFYINFI